ncbi:MAG: nitroreductase family protein [Nanoarchaeota archaeon]
MELDKAIRERHSVRRFSTKKADWRDILKALDCARLAPLAGNISTLKFMLVSEEEKIKHLGRACQQSFIGTTGYIVVVVTDTAQLKRSYDERGEKYCSQQAGAAIENFLLKITDLGLSTCWVGAFSDFEVKKILEIPDEMIVEALFPIGYEMPPKSKQRVKPSLDSRLFFNKWKNKYMKPWRKPEA